MRVITQHTLGGPEVLTIADAPEPQPLPTEVLVRVKAIGLNPLEARLRAGEFPLIGKPPFILGWDISGVVEDAPQTWRFRPGDEVFGMPLFPRAVSAYAEVVSAPALHLARKPASLTHVQAAALPIVGLTAWQGLVDLAGVREGDRVLVHGGGGGVGYVAIQITKALGAHVITTASGSKRKFVEGFGADEVIDYTAVDFSKAVRDIDVVLDTIGGDTVERSLEVLRPGRSPGDGGSRGGFGAHRQVRGGRHALQRHRSPTRSGRPARSRRTRRTGQAPGPRAGDLPVPARRRRASAARRRSPPGQARPDRLIPLWGLA
ncbi:NADPH:quinone reductase-like Zn-dependent oxidoreductase [Streptomyces sp. SAI-135]|jgi:NADPH:quinone reductase-like Zn-dependent oxidoreductase|nr:NADPH:quinone reductase-like Zn-dependent oxidoreductase [Streptomyces sp. SAI-090]MDH6554315.1 NADPH:quinone reductase-like Zn-dependent oxidoreductase [Streptomyces sp. SAI-041]MDH6573579.1 NADPH:quinone reductase-like Zn-dependent oxidoreductase [Streptomyces sp. SAI-117]MDH6581685.1 NADPH:quinone reductase-like Zn-dependent oxidoreductase [Streptomyces sp. SAI-133]MDH6613690.1 NADPH:quinone reductase-like Zn-dependent oxidoreductase [Streptomyces sp. SAI-135]